MGTIIIDNGVYKDAVPLRYKPIKVPLWKVRYLMWKGTFRDSCLEEELRWNLAHNKYDKRYSKRLRKLMSKYFKREYLNGR
jgi:hypothetical protein